MQKLFFYLSLIFFTGLIGCSQREDLSKTLCLHFDSDPTTLDPALMTDVKSGKLSALLYDTLLQYNENLTLHPALARSWKISKDGKIYTFFLRKNMRFQDGIPLTAEDIVFSLERLAHPSTLSPRAWILSHVEGFQAFRSRENNHLTGLEIKTPLIITIRLEEPFSPFLSLLTLPNASILSKKAFEENKSFMGTGPFLLDHWRHDYEILLKSNPLYYQGKAKIEKIRFRMIKETLFVSSEFKRGHLDLIDIPGPEISLYLEDPKWKDKIIEQKNLSLYYLGLNMRRSPFISLEYRRAVTQAIDTASIIQSLRKNRSLPVNGPIPPGVFGYNKDLSTLPFNSYRARQILQSSSQIRQELVLLESTNEETREIAEAIQAQLEKIGIHVKIVEEEWSSFKMSLAQGNFDLCLMSWWADYPEGENFLYPLFHSSNIGAGGNYTGLHNPEIDQLIEKLQRTTSIKRRLKLYRSIQKKILKECPMVFLYSSVSPLVKQPWIDPVIAHPLYNGNKFLQIEKRPH